MTTIRWMTCLAASTLLAQTASGAEQMIMSKPAPPQQMIMSKPAPPPQPAAAPRPPQPPHASTPLGSVLVRSDLAVLPGDGLMGNAGAGLIGNTGAALAGNSGGALIGNAGAGLAGNSGGALQVAMSPGLSQQLGRGTQSLGGGPVHAAFRRALGRDPRQDELAAWTTRGRLPTDEGFAALLRTPGAGALRRALVQAAHPVARPGMPLSGSEVSWWADEVGRRGWLYEQIVAEMRKTTSTPRGGGRVNIPAVSG
jgi:hypothetical protein